MSKTHEEAVIQAAALLARNRPFAELGAEQRACHCALDDHAPDEVQLLLALADALETNRRTIKADRLERIATACMAGVFPLACSAKDYAKDTVAYAKALIAELDKEPTP